MGREVGVNLGKGGKGGQYDQIHCMKLSKN